MRVLVTGACGLVGSAVVRELLDRGAAVTATDLDGDGNRKTAASLQHYAATSRGHFDIEWADLTTESASATLTDGTSPDAVVHLAAIIPPFCYARPQLARAVNVDATGYLVTACMHAPTPPRFVLASSIAVYGSRNPHSEKDLLTEDTPRRPTDLYGSHKAEAEDIVTESGLDGIVLRLGAVISAGLALDVDPELITFQASLPGDGRLQTVSVDDVARAFGSALTLGPARSVFLIGGDESHRVRQYELASRTAEAMGMAGGIPAARPGDPDLDSRWFATDWMDTTHSQRILDYQRVSFAGLLRETRERIGRRRPLMRLVAPWANLALRMRSPYRGRSGRYADPWEVARERWGAPDPDLLAPPDPT